jgi:hypothetical protein
MSDKKLNVVIDGVEYAPITKITEGKNPTLYEIKEPENHKHYYFITDFGVISIDAWLSSSIDHQRLQMQNVFFDKEKAVKYLGRKKLLSDIQFFCDWKNKEMYLKDLNLTNLVNATYHSWIINFDGDCSHRVFSFSSKELRDECQRRFVDDYHKLK